MTRVFAALAVSVDGFITGRSPGPGRGLGDGGALFDWYGDPGNAGYFNELVERVGAVVTGRTTYDDSEGFGGRGPHPTAPMVVVSHRPPPSQWAPSDWQTFASSIEEAVERARELAGVRDVGIQGGVTLTGALRAGLVDEVILHQVPVLLGGGRPFFTSLPSQIRLQLIAAVPASGVTHLHYRIEK